MAVKQKVIPIHQDIPISHRPMSLILKITEKCNFKCTFCSSPNLSQDKQAILDLNKVFDFIKHYPNTSTIILNGGDPMVVPVDYYKRLLDFLEKHSPNTIVSFTSNLWPFLKNPARWLPILKHPQVRVMTSFQYGSERLKHDGLPFTESEFWEISNLCLDELGYRPDFISVLTENNVHCAIDHVYLAKKMGVICKLNPAVASGHQSKPFLYADAIQVYLNIIDKGLYEHEHNAKALINTLRRVETICPVSRNCDASIRVLQPDGGYYSCGAMGDNQIYPIDYHQEVYQNRHYQPLTDDINIQSMNDNCYTCELFDVCNGCRKTIKDHKDFNINKIHCDKMHQMKNKLLSLKIKA